MKTFLSAFAVAGTLFTASLGTASAVTINSTAPTWSTVQGGTNISLNSTTGNGNNTVTNVLWGQPAGNAQSGLGFNPANPPAIDYAVNTTFLLGTLFHYNNPISAGTAASAVNLNLLTNITGATPVNQTFSYQFLIDETPNSGRAQDCPYPSNAGNPCSDKISFVNLDTSNAFVIGGVSYTIALTGFSTNSGASFTNDFISQEGSTNSAGLYARITAATPTQVPEPMSIILIGTGLLGLGMIRRRNA